MNIDTLHQIKSLKTRAWMPAMIAPALVAACAAFAPAALADDNRAPDVPQQISVGETNKVHFHGFGVGLQVYTWNGTSWGTAVPDATLFDEDGNVVALHFAGPSWQSNSGSLVVGALPPSGAIIMDPTAIPWLRLVAKTTEGPGVFANTTFIQRVNTSDNKAPSQNSTFIGQVTRIPYTADYFFYRHNND